LFFLWVKTQKKRVKYPLLKSDVGFGNVSESLPAELRFELWFRRATSWCAETLGEFVDTTFGIHE